MKIYRIRLIDGSDLFVADSFDESQVSLTRPTYYWKEDWKIGSHRCGYFSTGRDITIMIRHIVWYEHIENAKLWNNGIND